MSVVCYVGLGSNAGDRLAHLRRGLRLLEETDGVEVIRESSVYETEPVGPKQPDFLNAVVELRTTLRPHELLFRLKEIEREIGRTPSERWGPRQVDLDLLLYGDEAIDEASLRVPHPEIAARAFVLVPLTELNPDARIGARTASELRQMAPPLRVERTNDGLR